VLKKPVTSTRVGSRRSTPSRRCEGNRPEFGARKSERNKPDTLALFRDDPKLPSHCYRVMEEALQES